jgi:hypothetical protein
MRSHTYKFTASVFSSLLLGSLGQDKNRMPLSINWHSERIISDGNYAITHNEAFLFARLSPASAVVTPADITSLDHAETIPKGTILAWDSEHKIACEPIRRRGQGAV